MKYIFDVDHTLFDTKKFSQDAEPYKSDGTWVTPRIWEILDARDYVYPDVNECLEKLGKNNVELLTAVTPELGPESEAFQKTKLEKSGLMELAKQTTFMVGLKGSYVKKLIGDEESVFVDDRIEQAESVRELSPRTLAILMDRVNLTTGSFEKVPTLSEFKRATNLTEVVLIIEKWQQEMTNQ